jgi:hypothetical protein
MTAEAFALSVWFKSLTCHSCGVPFALSADQYNQRIKDRKDFYCPNGHGQHFLDKTEEEKLREQLEAEKRNVAWQKTQREAAEKSVIAMRGQVTKARNQLDRVKNGVCPCCKRSFENLHRHMQTKHPEWSPGAAGEGARDG